MPRFDRYSPAEGPVVKGFAPGGFVVDGGVYPGLFLTPGSAHEWRPPALAELAIEHLDQILGISPAPEFLLLGTGARLSFPPRSLAKALDDRGMGIETMDSRAAARAWGLLRAEERWIVAALMPLSAPPSA